MQTIYSRQKTVTVTKCLSNMEELDIIPTLEELKRTINNMVPSGRQTPWPNNISAHGS